ncbi:tetratricopeptide repeat protein [Rickettsia sp. TH2014]|uniref:tetratricopeptide repeat protein n=1 Tax=Rickettsia sp. TH2014 TaxID=1967503 RepID=UPI0021141121|nr:tetratricopeptide repeat protein [Rickettsia sp. TH2014]
MKNVEYQENIAAVEEVKMRRKNMKSYVLALELCNKVMKTAGIDNIPSEDHINLFNLKVYKNGIVALSELLVRTIDEKTKIKDEELIECYEPIINLLEKFIRPKNDAEYYFKQGQRLYGSGEYKEALISFEEASNIITRSMYYHHKGKALLKLERADVAIKAFNRAIELNPDYAEAYNEKGYALASLAKHNEAISCYNQAIALKPDDAEAYYNKGRSLCELCRYTEAVICFGKASTINPNFKLAMIHQTSTINYLKDRTLQAQTKDLIKRISRTKLIGN